MYTKFGEDDPDSINVSLRKTNVLFLLNRYEEALKIGNENLNKYTKFYGEMNKMRFEQLLVVFNCYIKLGKVEQIIEIKESIINIATQLFAEDSTQLEALIKLCDSI